MRVSEDTESKSRVAVLDRSNYAPSLPLGYLGVVILAIFVVLIGLLLVAVSNPRMAFGVDEIAGGVEASYEYEVVSGRLTVTLVQPGVKGWKVIEVDDRDACNNASVEDFEAATKVVDSSQASQSVTITTEALTNYCFWALRDTDDKGIIRAYLSADYIRRADQTSINEIEASYLIEYKNNTLTIRLIESGVQGWQAIEVDSQESCKTGNFAGATKVVDSSQAAQSATITVEPLTNYCFWALRDTDDIKVILSYVSAEIISGLTSVPVINPPAIEPPVINPVEPPVVNPPAEPPVINPVEPPVVNPPAIDSPNDLFLLIEVVSQIEKGSETVLEVVANQPITDGSAIRLDLASTNQCTQNAFADANLLHQSTTIEDGKLYITVAPADHGQSFCLQIESNSNGQTRMAFDISPPVNLSDTAADPDEEDNNEDQDKDKNKDADNKKDEDKASESTSDDDITGIDSSSFLFPVIIITAAVGIATVVVIVVSMSRGKPKGF